MTLLSVIGLALAVGVLAVTPGPGVFATVARALGSGFRPALAVVLGIVTGDILFLLLAAYGLSLLAQSLGELFLLIKWCGAVYLIWLGIRLWLKNPDTGYPDPDREAPGRTAHMISGLLITLSNPKVILFYCGFLPTFLDLGTLKNADILIAAAVVAAVLGTVLSGYAFLASRARALFTRSGAVRRLNRASGSVMIATGVAIGVK